MIKPDVWIRSKCISELHPMIEPFEDRLVRVKSVQETDVNGTGLVEKRVVSYGLSSFGYDCRVGNKFKVFTNLHSSFIDPKNFDHKSFIDVEVLTVENPADHIVIPPNSFALAMSLERFKIPRNVMVVGIGKSTYARCGIILNVTPFEPEWEGYATLEISNTTPLPARIYANEGICQLLFFESDTFPMTSYKDRGGRYQGQTEITPAKV